MLLLRRSSTSLSRVVTLQQSPSLLLGRHLARLSTAAKSGDLVSVRLKAYDVQTREKLADSDQELVKFVVGQGRVVPGLDRTIVGMKIGTTMKQILKPADAFGIRDPAAIVKLARKINEENPPAEVGGGVEMNDGRYGRVVALTTEEITVDFNHPLAEKEIEFEVELVQVEDASTASPQETGGLHVQTLVKGDGKTFPTRGSRVKVHYVGTLAKDGKEFDSSRRRDKPFTFVLGTGQVIAAWEMGIAKMTVGEKANIYCPPELAYGSQAVGPIPANSSLVFEVELLAVE